MDAFGHVNNVTFLTYMQEARTGMLFAGEAAEHIPDLIKGVVVARHEIDYRRPLEWRPEPVEVDVWTARGEVVVLRVALRDTRPTRRRRAGRGADRSWCRSISMRAGLDGSRPSERDFLVRYLEP